MRRERLWLLPGLFCLVLIPLLACGPRATPTPTAKSTPSPTSKPTTSLTPSPSLTSTSALVSFAGKAITIVVAFAAGGTGDLTARVCAKYLGRFLPGKPSIVVRNMPGGSGIFGTNYAYSSKPDGLTSFYGGGGVHLLQYTGESAVQYDLRKTPLMVTMGSAAMYYVKPGIVERPEDILKAKGIIYGSQVGSAAYLLCTARELLDFPIERMVLAYAGGGEARRAFLTGETTCADQTSLGYWEVVAPDVQSGKAQLLFQSGLLDRDGNVVKAPGFPSEAMTPFELYQKIYGKLPPSVPAVQAYKALLSLRNYNGALFLTPGTPDSIVRAYWDALEKMLKDPEFYKDSARLAAEAAFPLWSTGEAADKQHKLTFGMDSDALRWLREVMRKYGVETL